MPSSETKSRGRATTRRAWLLLALVSSCAVAPPGSSTSSVDENDLDPCVPAEGSRSVPSAPAALDQEPVLARAALLVRLASETGVAATELYLQGFDETGMCYARMILDPKPEVLFEDLWPGEYVLEAWNVGRHSRQRIPVRPGVVTDAEVRIHPRGRPRTEVGTITVVDDGTRRAPESGWVEFYLDNDGCSAVARVAEGRWSVALGEWENRPMAVSRMELDGRPAHADPVHFIFEDHWNGTDFAIDARYTPQTALEVVNRATGKRIPQIEIHAISELDSGENDASYPPNHPDRDFKSSGEIRSIPTELLNWVAEDWPDWRPIRRWWIRAPGYGWKRVVSDHAVGGRIVVELVREPTGTQQ